MVRPSSLIPPPSSLGIRRQDAKKNEDQLSPQRTQRTQRKDKNENGTADG